MKSPIKINLLKLLKLEYLLLLVFIVIIFSGIQIPKIAYWIIINNCSIVLFLNLENGKHRPSDFLQPRLITYLVCVLNVFILFTIL